MKFISSFLKILIGIMFLPITLIVLAVKKFPRSTKHKGRTAHKNVDLKGLNDVDKHFAYMKQINSLYSRVSKSKNFLSPLADELEKLCLADIALAPAVKKEFRSAPVYPSFRQLGTLYEKRGDFSDAEKIYRKAIAEGFNNDGTSSKISGRLKKLSQKKKESKK